MRSAKPNVVLIVADDMGFGDLGIFNGGRSRTDTLDEMAREGVCLPHHYSGSPICAPARAALLTGRYPHRTGALGTVHAAGQDRIALDEFTIADAFKASGYATGLVGKWHNGAFDSRYHPNARGFDEFVGFSGGWHDYYRWQLDHNGSTRESDGRYLTDVLTEDAIRFVRDHNKEPFFLMLTYSAPHTPLQAPTELVEKYERQGLKKGTAYIYAMIEMMDIGIGRLLDALDGENLSDQTVVCFTSDNGPAFQIAPQMNLPYGVGPDMSRFNYGLNGAKRSVYEGGIRVPMIMRWPDELEGGRHVDHMVHFVDWLPTLLSLAGVPRVGDAPLDGTDLWSVIRGDESAEETAHFWQWNDYDPIPASNAAMREGRWKRPSSVGQRVRSGSGVRRIRRETVRS